jgi:transposase
VEKRGLTRALIQAGSRPAAGVEWSDEMRVGLLGTVRRVWAPRGLKVVQLVEYTHEWLYLVLTVNPVRGTLRWAWVPNMKGVSLAPVLRGWAQRGLRTVVWDRAPGHRGPASAGLKVQRIEQPPYSPELNPTERIFEYLREAVEGFIYGTLSAKIRAVEAELRRLAACPQRVKSLAGWAWIGNALRKFRENS